MKRLMLVCLLLVFSHGRAADLNPECYTLYDQFLSADWVNAGRVAGSNAGQPFKDPPALHYSRPQTVPASCRMLCR